MEITKGKRKSLHYSLLYVYSVSPNPTYLTGLLYEKELYERIQCIDGGKLNINQTIK